MFIQEEIQNLTGVVAYDQAGQKIGHVATVYKDRATGEPEWLTVKTGLFGTKESFVPLALARARGAREVELAADKDTITSAPKIDPEGELSPAEEERLFSHYGLDFAEWRGPGGLPETRGQTAGSVYDAPGTLGYDTSGPTTDDAMTRSEERAHVGTVTEEIGRRTDVVDLSHAPRRVRVRPRYPRRATIAVRRRSSGLDCRGFVWPSYELRRILATAARLRVAFSKDRR